MGDKRSSKPKRIRRGFPYLKEFLNILIYLCIIFAFNAGIYFTWWVYPPFTVVEFTGVRSMAINALLTSKDIGLWVYTLYTWWVITRLLSYESKMFIEKGFHSRYEHIITNIFYIYLLRDTFNFIYLTFKKVQK